MSEQEKDTHPNAGRASGYTDGSGNSVGENIINRVTELMLGPQTKLVLLADQLNTIVATHDRRFEYVLAQLDAHLKKEDARHDALEQSENQALNALTSVAHRLDEITSYVQQSVTLAREGIAIGKEARATGIEALGIAKAGAARLGKVEKAITTLKAGQSASKKQADIVLQLLKESQSDRADLRKRIETLSATVEEHNRVSAEHAALMLDVAEVKARLEALEARGG